MFSLNAQLPYIACNVEYDVQCSNPCLSRFGYEFGALEAFQ